MGASRRYTPKRPYPRGARVNELLREVLAEELERLADADDRLELLTLTAVACEPGLRHAVVYLASLTDPGVEALEEHRKELQSAVGAQVRMKRVPALRFAVDPAIEAGIRVEA